MKLIKMFPILLVVICCVIFFASKLLISYWYSPLKHLTEPQLYMVASGTGFNAVANDLSAKNILERPLLTTLWVRFFEPDFLLKVGEYRFPAFSSPAQIIDILGSGVSLQYKVTLVEGDSALQMLMRLSSNDTLQLGGFQEGDQSFDVSQQIMIDIL
ncbi:MAG: endolytic transglycosylase MltG, partial [Pseudomonadales bacterium]|nr:endolytic transglycosylase MltG [Pseudomonadales bacterium]